VSKPRPAKKLIRPEPNPALEAIREQAAQTLLQQLSQHPHYKNLTLKRAKLLLGAMRDADLG
jgi:hypothetical protein